MERGWIIDDDAIMEVAGRRREGLVMALTSLSGALGTVLALVLIVIAASTVDVSLGWYGQSDSTRNFLTFLYGPLVGIINIIHCLLGFYYPMWPGSKGLGELEQKQSEMWEDQSGATTRPNAMDGMAHKAVLVEVEEEPAEGTSAGDV